MALLRGRGASPIRPGLITKRALLGELPLADGSLVSEAAITDLFGAYRGQVNAENQRRTRDKQLAGMRLHSFYVMFKFAQLLKLVELVRMEPMLYPPPKGKLYSVRKIGNRISAVVSTRHIFRLTSIGREDDKSWLDLTRAWKEGWPAPQKVEQVIQPEILPVPPLKKARRGRPPKVEAPPAGKLFEEFKWVARPSMAEYRRLLAHLQLLNGIGISNPDVVAEVDRLDMRMGDWVVEIEDVLEDARMTGKASLIIRYTNTKNLLDKVFEALVDRDISRAIEALSKLTGQI